MVISKYQHYFFSSLYSVLAAILFGLIGFANYLNFASEREQISDLAPKLPEALEIAELVSEKPSLPTIAATYSSAIKTQAPYKKRNVSNSYISIGGKTISVYNAKNGLKDDAGSRVAKYNSTFYYGHNSSTVFGSLSSLADGTIFSITENGTTKTYKIARHEIFNKANNGTNDILYLESEGANRNYASGIYSASYRGKTYDIALMTCAGKSLGGGDATQRYVVFAYEV